MILSYNKLICKTLYVKAEDNMITNEKKATTRHFFAALAAAMIIGLISSVVRFFLPNAIVGDVLAIALFCILAYFVLIHYTSVFVYTLDGYSLTVTRKIGAREKQIIIKSNAVVSVCKKKPSSVKAENMCVSVFMKRGALCITYKDSNQLRAVWIEPENELEQAVLKLGK